MVTLMTKGKGLVGLDKTRPWGVVIQTDGGKPTGYACVPVTELAPLLRLVKSFGRKVSNEGDGVFKIDTKKKDLYVTEKDGWAIVCDSPEKLAQVPSKPGRMLTGLSKRYDMALQLNVGNASKECRKKMADCIRQHAKRKLERRSGGCEKQQAARKQMTEHCVKSIIAAINDLNRVTIGWKLDQEAGKASLDLIVIAKKGTKTAGQFALLADAKTNFGGFRLGGAALSCSAACTRNVDSSEAAIIDTMFKMMQAKVAKRIDEKVKSEAKAEVLKKFAAGMLDVAKETKKSGKVDGAMSLVLKPNAVTFISGRYVANPEKLEKTFGDLVAAIRKKYPDKVAKVLKPNAEKFKGVRLHKLSITIPEKGKCGEKAAKLVGEKLEVVMGIGPKCVYLAAGKNATAMLKKAITRSKKMADKPARPMQVTLDLGTIGEFIVAIGKDKCKEKAAKALAAAKDLSGDQIVITAVSIKNGVKCRLEVQPAALKMLATAKPHHHFKKHGKKGDRDKHSHHGHGDKHKHHGDHDKKSGCSSKKKSPAKT